MMFILSFCTTASAVAAEEYAQEREELANR